MSYVGLPVQPDSQTTRKNTRKGYTVPLRVNKLGYIAPVPNGILLPRMISFPLDLPDIELVWRLKSFLDFDRSRVLLTFRGSSQYCAFVLSFLLPKSAL